MAPICFTFSAAVLVLPGLSLALVFDGRSDQQASPFASPQAGAGFEQFGLHAAPNWPGQQNSQMSEQSMSPEIPDVQSLLGTPQQLGGLQLPYAQNLLGSLQQPQLGLPQYAPNLMDASQQLQLGSPQIPYTLGSQLGSGQMPYSQSLIGLSQEQQLGSMSLESTIMALQSQLAKERNSEMRFANLAAEKQQELSQMNQSYARILALSEKAADQEQQLQEQLANATAANEVLQADVDKIVPEEQQLQEQLGNATAYLAKEQQQVSLLREKLQVAEDRAQHSEESEQQQVSMLREKLQDAEDRAQQSERVKGRALRVMKDVQMAQEKVQRTEEMIHKLIPKNVLMSHRQ